MSDRKAIRPGWTTGGGAVILLVIAVPLYREFFVPGETVWNVLLLVFLVGLAVGALLLQLYFAGHAGEIGEARFDTRNKDMSNVVGGEVDR